MHKRAHRVARDQRDDATKAVHEPDEIDLFVEEVELDVRRRLCIGRRERYPAARCRLEDRGVEIGDLLAERAPGRFAVRGDIHVARRRPRQSGGIAQASHRMRPHRPLLARAAPQMRRDEQKRMVLQIAPDAAQVGNDINAEPAQFVRGADPGAQQKCRRMNGAGAQRDLAGVKIPLRTVDPRGDADEPLSFKQQSGHGRAGEDLEIFAGTHRGIEIAHRGRAAARRRVAHRQRAVAVAEIAVHVGDMRRLPFAHVLLDGARQRRPLLRAACAGSELGRCRRAARHDNRNRFRACGNMATLRASSSPTHPSRSHSS